MDNLYDPIEQILTDCLKSAQNMNHFEFMLEGLLAGVLEEEDLATLLCLEATCKAHEYASQICDLSRGEQFEIVSSLIMMNSVWATLIDTGFEEGFIQYADPTGHYHV